MSLRNKFLLYGLSTQVCVRNKIQAAGMLETARANLAFA